MKASELRTKTLPELEAQLAVLQAERIETRRSHAAGELANTRVLRNQRRDVALLKTVIAEQRNDSNNKENQNA